LKFHGVAVFVRSQEADIYSTIATRHTINDKYSNISCFGLFSGVFVEVPRPKLLSVTNRKSNMGFRLTPKLMTLYDLELL